MESFTFKPYNVKLPSQVRAIVTAKIRRNVYWMRDADILSILSKVWTDSSLLYLKQYIIIFSAAFFVSN